jgi:hypothetical protein
MHVSWKRALIPCAAVALLSATTSGAAAQELQLGRVISVNTSGDHPADFSFRAEAAGILTVVARSSDSSDIVLVVADGDGQPIRDGRSDQDLGSNAGAEQFPFTIPRAGVYHVRVEPFGSGSATVRVGASWLPYPELEVPPDPDGAPSQARRLGTQQQTIDESVNPAGGDGWDWYAVTAESAGTLTVATRAEEGDLVLEAFEEGSFDSALERSDDDLQGVSGNEALTLSISAGQTLYFKVSTYSDDVGMVQYRLQVGFIPG